MMAVRMPVCTGRFECHEGSSYPRFVPGVASAAWRGRSRICWARNKGSLWPLERPWTKTGVESCQGTPSYLYEELKSKSTLKTNISAL